MRKNNQAWIIGMTAVGMATVLGCGGLAPKSPTATPGGLAPNGQGTAGSASGQSCRTGATKQHSVQTFVDGHVVTTDTSCVFNGSTEVVCSSDFVDSVGGPGKSTQTS